MGAGSSAGRQGGGSWETREWELGDKRMGAGRQADGSWETRGESWETRGWELGDKGREVGDKIV